MITFHQATVTYPTGVVALQGIDLHIDRGEFVCLVGTTSSGKSTLLKAMYLEERLTAGKLHLLGRDWTDAPARLVPLLRRNIGVVFQDFQLLAGRTVAENVAFSLQVIGADPATVARRVPQALHLVGLSDRAANFPGELSGGEQQRVSIARAIINNPPILLCDEPTGNLDPATSLSIVELLREINRRGTTIVMATHDEQIVDRLQTRVVYLEQGRLTADRKGGYRHATRELELLPA
ncbi:MAG TPA: cell division ATP-binding protein FtsE [bacterium]|nr:cell division ATP-binding protein FtsE [bacterium]